MPKLTIDGREIEVPGGLTVIQPDGSFKSVDRLVPAG